jgi:hypothetical protein
MVFAFSLQDAASIATIIAAAIAGPWALYTWWHQERLRRIKADPGVEVGFECTQDPLPDGRVLLTIDCAVRNTGVMPIFPEAEKASFRIGQLDSGGGTGFLTRNMPVGDRQEIVCGSRVQGLRVEPNTETIFTAHYLAMPGLLYGIMFTLPSQIFDKNGKPWKWTKWRVVYVPPYPSAAEPSGEFELRVPATNGSSRLSYR